MKQTITETDLHLQYTMETGENFQFENRDQYHSTERYSREYAKWIEQKYLKLLKTNKNK